MAFLHTISRLLGFLSIDKPIYLLLEIHLASHVYTYLLETGHSHAMTAHAQDREKEGRARTRTELPVKNRPNRIRKEGMVTSSPSRNEKSRHCTLCDHRTLPNEYEQTSFNCQILSACVLLRSCHSQFWLEPSFREPQALLGYLPFGHCSPCLR